MLIIEYMRFLECESNKYGCYYNLNFEFIICKFCLFIVIELVFCILFLFVVLFGCWELFFFFLVVDCFFCNKEKNILYILYKLS